MSKNERGAEASKSKKKTDRRVVRTKGRLGKALVALIHEKPFDEIRLQEVLERAEVGRSTFYLHYKDKDDLFLSDVEEFLERVAHSLNRQGEHSDRVLPVRELFEHVGVEAKQFHQALVASGRIHDFYDLARGQMARGIEQRLKENPRANPVKPAQLRALSHAYAGAMLSLLRWWIETGTKESPQEMDRLFHRLVWGETQR